MSVNLLDHALSRLVISRARELGFDLAGIAPATPSEHGVYFRRWLDEGKAGEMHYLAGRFEQRENPDRYLEGAQSVICVAINYCFPLDELALEQRSSHGRIARYALGEDYHTLIKGRLFKLADWLRELVPQAQTRVCVDTAPVMEKELAARAGIGWLGKNACIINPKIGSWLLLGEILTTIPLTYDEPAIDHCGSCTRCIDACPTAAITAPYQIDARKCISYLTIEHRGPIEPALADQIGDWLYGCDICQDVCPHNRKAPAATDPALRPRFPTGTLNVHEVMSWSADDCRIALRASAMKRVKLPVLQRNATIVARNLRHAT